ncbi:MAG: hypothetical protein RIS75_1003 [Actinomycetota bacterium]
MVSKRPSLSLGQAQQAGLKAQGLWQKPRSTQSSKADIHALTARFGAVQLDTISVLARSHELVAYARLGAMPRATVESGYWRPAPHATHFEYWSHAASILPIEMWPLFEFRREQFRERGFRWHKTSNSTVEQIKRQLRTEGPLTTTSMGGAKKGSYWWEWSDAKIAIEYLLDIGEVVCTNRIGWQRQYDLAERALGKAAQRSTPTIEALETLLHGSLKILGVATRDDILDVHRLKASGSLKSELMEAWNNFVESPLVVEVDVEDWPTAYASAEILSQLDRTKPNHSVLLSPFDPMIWYRPRLQRMFDMEYRIESYTPAAKRVFGYFAMPVLHRGKLIARVDPGREGTTLVAKTTTFQVGQLTEDAITGTAAALKEAARWVGCNEIKIDNTASAKVKKELQRLVNAD